MNNIDLSLSSYDFDLPKSLIAERPCSVRHDSKLLVYNATTDEVIHTHFNQLPNFIPNDSLLVANQSKVFPCRLVGKKPTGGKCEIFVLSLKPDTDGHYQVLIKTSSKKQIGDQYFFESDLIARVEKIGDGHFYVSFNCENSKQLEEKLSAIGKIPIPPYIRGGESDEQDVKNYQTVYAKEQGSVAAPTAGLHFTAEVFKDLSAKNIDQAFVTLHVGLGTFAPVKTDDLADHKMHTEEYFISKDNLEMINSGRKIFAVGTTSLRVLESAYNGGAVSVTPDEIYKTNIFLHPGVDVKSIAGLVTNFHLPKSTLLMLVSSLIGREKTMDLYKEAISHKYRFFSYGDAMLIIR
jgi:S-adenosylmethionine:tRNA ribosyltransferase-isomerase